MITSIPTLRGKINKVWGGNQESERKEKRTQEVDKEIQNIKSMILKMGRECNGASGWNYSVGTGTDTVVGKKIE